MPPVVHVAVGVIQDSAGQVLIALRPPKAHQGGLWEFPGGKCEPGESVESALIRELEEELGITALQQEPLCRICHDYGDKKVLLDVRRVTSFAGLPVGREGQPLRWVSPAELDPAHFPVANRAIIRRLQLPHLLPITGTAPSGDAFFDHFRRLLADGHTLVQLRAPDVDRAQFQRLARQCLLLCQEYGCRLLLNADAALLETVPAAGIHATGAQLHSLTARPLSEAHLFGASCHSLADLQHAEAAGADYAFLSPVRQTTSHPGQEGIGWDVFETWVRSVGIPVYALGGLGRNDLPEARRRGALGIAAISAFWH